MNAVLNTVFSGIAAIPTGGTSTAAPLASYGPVFLNAYNTYSTSNETGNRTISRDSFTTGLSKHLQVMMVQWHIKRLTMKCIRRFMLMSI